MQIKRDVIGHVQTLVRSVKVARLAIAPKRAAQVDGCQLRMADTSRELADLVRRGLDGGSDSFRWLYNNLDPLEKDFGKSTRDAAYKLLEVYSWVQTGATAYAALGIQADSAGAERSASPEDQSIQDQWEKIRVQRALVLGTITGAGDYVDGRLDELQADIQHLLG